jgi:integrase
VRYAPATCGPSIVVGGVREPFRAICRSCELSPLGLRARPISEAALLTGTHLERWQDFRATVVTPGTQKLAAAAVRGALRWAATREPALVSPALWLRIESIRIPELLPRPIPRRDLEVVVAACLLQPVPGEDLMWLRSRALFLVILSSGARAWEALQLDRDQFQGRTATVIQKGGREKLIVISEAAETAVADYVAARADTCPALWVGHGRKDPDLRLSYMGAYWGWKWLCARLAIPRFTGHQIRHSCATELHRQKVDSLTIAKHLGQRGLGSIQGYAEVGLEERHQMLEVMDGRFRSVQPWPPTQPPAALAVVPPVAPEDPVAAVLAADPSMSMDDLKEWAVEEGRSIEAQACWILRDIEINERPMTPEEEVERRFLEWRIAIDVGDADPSHLQAFALSTGRTDLIAESFLTAEQYALAINTGGGEYPLEGLRESWKRTHGPQLRLV